MPVLMKPLDRNTTPPGGWRFYQPETGWSMPNPLSQSWATAVEAIMQHRKANPALEATAGDAAADLEAYTRSRVPGEAVRDNGSGQTVRKPGGCLACGKR